jgi:hypothetical protein
MPQHDTERIGKLENLRNHGLDGFTRGTAKLVLLLCPPASLHGDRIVHVLITRVFVRGIRCFIRDSEVLQISL